MMFAELKNVLDVLQGQLKNAIDPECFALAKAELDSAENVLTKLTTIVSEAENVLTQLTTAVSEIPDAIRGQCNKLRSEIGKTDGRSDKIYKQNVQIEETLGSELGKIESLGERVLFLEGFAKGVDKRIEGIVEKIGRG